MDNLFNNIDILTSSVESSDFYQEYLKAKTLFNEDPIVNSLLDEIKDLQKQRVNANKLELVNLVEDLTNTIDKLQLQLDSLFVTVQYAHYQEIVNENLDYLSTVLKSKL